MTEPTPFGNKYVLTEHIATGSTAKIYRAQETDHNGSGKELAIKQLREEYTLHSEAIQNFLKEGRLAATFNHAHIVQTYEAGVDDGEYYVAVELIKGQELVAILRQAMASEDTPPLSISLGIILQVLEGLQYIHSYTDKQGKHLGLCHGDINPTNIYLSEDGICKIANFGNAATRAKMQTKTGRPATSFLAYTAPEQLRGYSADPRSDIFATGILLYEMCLGRRLFRGKQERVFHRICEGDVPVPTFLDPEFPPALEAIIMKALEVDETDRYPTSAAFLRDLKAFAEEAGLLATPRTISAYVAEFSELDAIAPGSEKDVYADVESSSEMPNFSFMESFDSRVQETKAPPEWAKSVEAVQKNAQVGAKKRSMTIANLDQFVANIRVDSQAHPSAPALASEKKPTTQQPRSQKETPRNLRSQRTPRGLKSTSSDAGRSFSSTRSPSVSVDPSMSLSSGTFAHQVMSHQRSKAATATIWLLVMLGIGVFAWIAYTMFTSK